MNILAYVYLLALLLVAMLAAFKQMGEALDNLDLEQFSLWTCVASVIAGLPILLW